MTTQERREVEHIARNLETDPVLLTADQRLFKLQIIKGIVRRLLQSEGECA